MSQPMTTKERQMAAWRCREVDHVPFAFHFWPHPRHPRVTWKTERERLEFYRRREWDARVQVGTPVTPLDEVHVEVRYETLNDQTVLHQSWHTPGGTIEERLRVTDEWPEGRRDAGSPVAFADDFRAARYIEFPFKSTADLAALPYLFPVHNPRDVQQLAQTHRDARTLADAFDVPVVGYHTAGMDWLIWLYPPEEIILLAQQEPSFVGALLDAINHSYANRLQTLLELGVDAVCRPGWGESADFWSPRLFSQFARQPMEQEICACHAAGCVHVYQMFSGVLPLLEELKKLDFDCLFGIDPVPSNQEMAQIRRALPGKSLWGGISGPQHLCLDTPGAVELAVEQAFEAWGPRGFVLGAAAAIRDTCPWENLEACERAWRRLRDR
jgi:uroporphyrinogen-III decarboxylase